MATHPLAGKPAPHDVLTNIEELLAAYYSIKPDPANPDHRVAFGTSGHRGTSTKATFNEYHILAVSQAICDYRKTQGYTGPLFLGKDTHALSDPAHLTAIEVFAANQVEVYIQENQDFTPTPVISHAILTYNLGRKGGFADGVVITPSHNPPADGGYKYNPPSGGPADTETTQIIQDLANQILANNLQSVKRFPIEKALKASNVHTVNFATAYIQDLKKVIQIEQIANAKIKIGVDPLGGAAVNYWDQIAELYGLNIEVVNRAVDPTFSFMTLDHDGKIRMDCSSPYAMANLIQYKDQFDIAFGNDPDVDRHGIVTRSAGLMNPNHYLSTAIYYLFQNRPDWKADTAIGKTLVSSSMIDRVAKDINRKLCEVPVGFKWFVDGLLTGEFGFGGEESAGASFLRLDGTVWTTDKDGILLNLLAAEILAVTDADPGEHYASLEKRFGKSFYQRMDAPANASQRKVLANLNAGLVHASSLAGEPILDKLTHAPGNNAPVGGLKVVTNNGWFAARPSGTENIYKIYAESFISEDHLHQIQHEAQNIVSDAFQAAGI